jgi:hypothetical protein
MSHCATFAIAQKIVCVYIENRAHTCVNRAAVALAKYSKSGPSQKEGCERRPEAVTKWHLVTEQRQNDEHSSAVVC